MKLGTIIKDGEWRTVILTRAPDHGAAVVVDIARAVEVLKKMHGLGRLHWVTGWEGPWGKWHAPADMIDIARHGRTAVVALNQLEQTFWNFARSSDAAWAQTALLDPNQVTWQAPIPEPPIFFYMHNNSTFSLNFQFTKLGRRDILHPRNRPITSVIGHNESLFTDATGYVKTDMELGFIVGPSARLATQDTAMDYVFGYTVCSDSRLKRYVDQYAELGDKQDRRFANAAPQIEKACDGYGAFGPVIVTADEVGDPHDLLGHIYVNGIHRCRAHTGMYLDTVRDTLANLSHLMTVPAGTLVAMAAVGYDGFGVEGPHRQTGQNCVEIEFERVGKLRLPLVYPDKPVAKERSDRSPYLSRRSKLGLPSSDMPDLSPEHVPARTRSCWALHCNLDDPEQGRVPTQYLYPRSSLARAEDAIVLPGSRRDIEISLQLAAIIGPKPIYQLKSEDVNSRLFGMAVFIGLSDLAVSERRRTAGFSPLFSYYQSRFEDGFNRVARPVPLNQLGEGWRKAAMNIEVEGMGSASGNVADYSCGFEHAIEWITQGVTLLPGDIVCLGPSRAAVKIPFAGQPGATWKLRVSIGGFPQIETMIVDQRDAKTSSWHPLKLQS